METIASPKRQKSLYVDRIKPLLDRAWAALWIVLLALPCALAALAIKLDSRGPVLFKQCRVGKGGKTFCIYKFRTMYIDSPDESRSPESDSDPRVTPVGRWLRKTSMDELPQLINIFKGEMSFVGPRPEMQGVVRTCYTDYEKQRLAVSPGLTGLWQISDVRDQPIHHNLHYDLAYIQNISFKLDVAILLRTLKVVFKSNTY